MYRDRIFYHIQKKKKFFSVYSLDIVSVTKYKFILTINILLVMIICNEMLLRSILVVKLNI